VSNEAPSRAKTKSRTCCGGVKTFSTVWNSWMPGHLSRLPNAIGTSPSRLASASICSSSPNDRGSCGTLSRL
jgi:hypothetical protein